MDGKAQPTTSEMIIMIAGAVMLVASFFDFARIDVKAGSAWGKYLFPIATLLPLYGVVMAAQIALTKFANVKLPDAVRRLHVGAGASRARAPRRGHGASAG